MKHIVAVSLAFLFFTCLSVRPAHACFICGSGGGGYPSCAVVGAGAEACVTSSDPPYCSTYFDDCCNDGGGGCGCVPCNGGCCASLQDNRKGSFPTVKRMALQEIAVKPEASKPDHLKEFLAMAESGAFDGKTVNLDASGTIARGILNLPLDHWKSFTHQVVMKGWQKDPRLDPKVQSDSTPQELLQVETKTGHRFVIHLISDSAIKKALVQQQSKSQQPGVRDKL